MRGEVDGEDLPRRMLVNRVHEDLQSEDPIIISILCNVDLSDLSVKAAGCQPVSVGREGGVPHFSGVIVHNLKRK